MEDVFLEISNAYECVWHRRTLLSYINLNKDSCIFYFILYHKINDVWYRIIYIQIKILLLFYKQIVFAVLLNVFPWHFKTHFSKNTYILRS